MKGKKTRSEFSNPAVWMLRKIANEMRKYREGEKQKKSWFSDNKPNKKQIRVI